MKKKYKTLLIWFFGISWLIAFLGSSTIKIIYYVYDLPTWVNSSATGLFFDLGIFCMLLTSIAFFFDLWIKKKWERLSFFDKARSFFGIAIALPFFLLLGLEIFKEIMKIWALF